MKNIQQLTSEIQGLCIQGVSDTDILKEIFSLLKEIENRKKEVTENIVELAEDYNKLARELENVPAEKLMNDEELTLNYCNYQAKREALRTCVKMIEEL